MDLSNNRSPNLTKSFANVVVGGGSVKLDLKVPSSHKGEPTVCFSSEDIVKLSSPLKFALVGKFSHGRPSLPEIRKAMESFGLKAVFQVVYWIRSIF